MISCLNGSVYHVAIDLRKNSKTYGKYFSIKISRKGAGLETTYSILPKVRKVPDKIAKEWTKQQNTIWLPNFFEGKDPFDGKQVDEKGLPAGGTDARGSTVLPAKAKTKVVDDNESDYDKH